jgi:hypothetical protein
MPWGNEMDDMTIMMTVVMPRQQRYVRGRLGLVTNKSVLLVVGEAPAFGPQPRAACLLAAAAFPADQVGLLLVSASAVQVPLLQLQHLVARSTSLSSPRSRQPPSSLDITHG